jgi:hypothetical protein
MVKNKYVLGVMLLSFLAAACDTGGVNGVDTSSDVSALTSGPGTIISSQSVAFSTDLLFGTPDFTVQAWKIVYQSTDALGNPDQVSGTILVPISWWLLGPRPILGFAPETQGMADRCAPSVTMPTGAYLEASLIKSALNNGWAVAQTDYQGLGTPGTHTYANRNSNGHAVLDVVRAAMRLSSAGLSTSAPVVIWGYSEGGQAATAAGELQPSYAPELKLKGVAAGGVPADPVICGNYLNGSAFMSFFMYSMLGLDAAYSELQLKNYLNATGTAAFATANNTCDIDGVLDFAFQTFSEYVTSDPTQTPAWGARIMQQKLGTLVQPVPYYQYHADLDEVVPIGQAQTLHATYCSMGVKTVFATVSLSDHILGEYNGASNALSFLNDRLAGRTAPRSCP